MPIDRRKLVLGASAFAVGSASAQSRGLREILESLGGGKPFSGEALLEAARELAKSPYTAPTNDLPQPLANLTAQQYSEIRSRPTGMLFQVEGRQIYVEPLHRGFIFNQAVQVAIVEDGQIRTIAYDSDRFSFGLLRDLPKFSEPGFSGVRIFGDPVNGNLRQVAVIQGATFFRSLARGQDFGVAARAIAIRVADQRGEELPAFQAFWLERPSRGDRAVTIHALINSRSLAGVWRATFRPGEASIVDVQTTIIARTGIEQLGIAPMSSTFLHGPIYRRGADDYRAAAFESDGLQMLTGKGEWLWRPVSNRTTLQISAFVDDNPRGFGLLQRTRDFSRFEDAEQHFEKRPSLWVEPIGEWGPGEVHLVEVPTDSDVNDNIIAFWRPRNALKAGDETTYSYRQFWTWQSPERSPLALVTGSRQGRGSGGRRRRFVIDFEGEAFAAAQRVVETVPNVWSDKGTISDLQLLPFPEAKRIRVSFQVDPGNEQQCELRCLLAAAGTPASETWLYRWSP
jgi:glucans biosynthesis protein